MVHQKTNPENATFTCMNNFIEDDQITHSSNQCPTLCFCGIFQSSLWEVLKEACELLSQVQPNTELSCTELWDTASSIC